MEVDEKRAALKRWLRARLTEDARAAAEWRALWHRTWAHLLGVPARDLIDAERTHALVDELAASGASVEALRPVADRIVRALVVEFREDTEPIDRVLSEEVRARLHAVLERPGLIHPEWVRASLRGEAMEAVLNDVLYRTLKDFSTLLPRMLTKLSPMGRFGVIGGAGALAEKMIGEVERLVEPEIRAFLSGRMGRVLESAAEFTITKLDDPAQIEFRATFLDFVLSRSPAFLLANVDDALLDDMGAIVELTARDLAERPETRAALHAWVDRMLAFCENKTLSELLEWNEAADATAIPALADATWPAWKSVVASPGVTVYLDGLVDELIDAYEALDAG